MKTSENPIRALVVDDDSSWLAILAELLIDLGLQVDQAANLDEAINALKTTPHRLAVVDLALSARDHHNRDGLQILEAARRYDPGCHTILLTGYATVELAVSVLKNYNAFTCLRKETFQRSNFRKLVTDVLAASPSTQSLSIQASHTDQTFSTEELQRLTERERQVLGLLVKGMTNKDIADTLIITPNTVKRHLKAIFEKLDVHTRSAAVAKAMKLGL